MKTIHYLILFLIGLGSLMTSCKKEEDLSVKGVALNKTTLTLKPGVEETLVVSFFPTNAANKNVAWNTSDESIVTVTNEGKVTAIRPGNATITVRSIENNESATCEVTVSLNDPLTVSGNVEGTWSKFSVINVSGHIYVPEGKTLTIEEGVEIIVSDASVDANGTKIEIIVNGSLHCKGTKEAPILFSINPSKRTISNAFGRSWGGIIGSISCKEILLLHTIVEYTGAITTLSSPSVVAGLFKPSGGDGMVAFNTNNPSGKYVIQNCTFRFTGEDAIYVQGGDCIFTNNLFYANGDSGGEAINVKAGCKVDAAFNVMYSPNTNALKLASSGQSPTRPQALIKGYNNTIINSGWRRDPDKPKGGSVWLEEGALVEIYNNLIVNSMFAVRNDSRKLPDNNSKVDYNYYASGTQQSGIPQHISNGTLTSYDGFKPGVTDIVIGLNDKVGTGIGHNDPQFVNFPFMSNPLVAYDNFSTSWDFHLQSGSPALTGAKTDFSPYFSNTGIQIDGVTYRSPAPKSHFGAFGTR
jgi:hypothetical protein